MTKILNLLVALLSVQALAEPAKKSICVQLTKAIAQGTASQQLNKFLSTAWTYEMTEFPEYATYAGYPGQNGRWSDRSLTAIQRHKKEDACALAILKKISPKSLKGEERVTYDLAKRTAERRVDGNQFPRELLVMDQLEGLQLEVPEMLESMPAVSKADYEDMIARLEQVPTLATQTEALMREGLKQHVTAVKMFISRAPNQFDRVLTPKIEDSPLFGPFKEINMNINEAGRISLRAKALDVLKNKTYPALQKLKDFVVTEYIPGCRETIAASDLPNGKAWYAFDVKEHTTTDMTPDQLHELGLKEVARIAAEMTKIREEVKFKGDAKEFNKFLLKDKRFFYDDKEKLMIGYRDIAKRIDPELPHLFKTLPRLTYGVKEMPAYQAAEAPAAYYEPGNLTAGRPGYFLANTTDLAGRPKWAMEALTAHEAVPGHHLQIAIAGELKGLPEFRKHEQYTAFTEGWGLYAEGLGADIGLYKDPYSHYGQLSYEMWRAIRLVVDTGMHAKGWTRQQALDYFAANMPKSAQETENEVDRYITWPGQALAYKVGQLKFLELREKAKAELGDKFDIREFHDQLLKHGALPMDVLEKSVTEWIDVVKKQKKQLKDRVQS